MLYFYRRSLQNKDQRYDSYGCVHFIELTDRQQITKKDIRYKTELKEIRWDIAEAIANYFPENAIDEIVRMIYKHKVILLITTPLKENLGTYNDRVIRINNDLQPNHFLEVFLHEYAHLLQFMMPFHKAIPFHGSQFYYCFEKLLQYFIHKKILSIDRFIPAINKLNNYYLYKQMGFTFALCATGIGTQFIYNNETLIRGKGIKGLIECKRIQDGTKIKLDPKTRVELELDLSW